MKLFVTLLLSAMMLFGGIKTSAAGKLNVDQENFHVISSYSTYGYAYAKVENTGDKAIKVNAGVLEIYDEAGNAITSTDYMQAYAEYLEPGQYTYVKMYSGIENGTATDYTLTVTGKSDTSKRSLRLPVETDLQLNVKDGWWTYNYMFAMVTNNTEEPLFNIDVALALLDADGNILYVNDTGLYSEVALMPGSSILVCKDIPSADMEYFEKNGLVPASVDAIAYVNVDVEQP